MFFHLVYEINRISAMRVAVKPLVVNASVQKCYCCTTLLSGLVWKVTRHLAGIRQ